MNRNYEQETVAQNMSGYKKKKLVLGITISGSTPLIRGQASYFGKKGYEVYLMCPRDDKSESYCRKEECRLIDVRIERYISPFKDLITLFQIVLKLRKIKPDIVNVGTPKMGLLGMLGAWLAGVPKRIYTCRGLRYEHETGFKRKLLETTERIPGKLAHTIICISPSVKEQAVDDGIFNPAKTEVISRGSSNGIDLERFNKKNVSAKEVQSLKEFYNLEDTFVFGFVGRLVDRKGINELYDAFDMVHKNYPETRLMLIGKKDLTQLTDPRLINDIKSHPGIIWVGWQDDIPLYMSLFDVFVMPAWWEGFGNSYVEAAAMGIPVIGTDGTGSRDAVSNGFNGIQIPIKQTIPLYKAMQKYYLDEKILEMHGANGIQWAENFRQKIVWDGIKKVYKN